MKKYQEGGNVGMSQRAMLNALQQMDVFSGISAQAGRTGLTGAIGQTTENMIKEWEEKLAAFEKDQKKAHKKLAKIDILKKISPYDMFDEIAGGVASYDIAKNLKEQAGKLTIAGYGGPGTRFGRMQQDINEQAKNIQKSLKDPKDIALEGVMNLAMGKVTDKAVDKIGDTVKVKGEDVAAGAIPGVGEGPMPISPSDEMFGQNIPGTGPKEYGRWGTNIRKQFGLGEGEKFFEKYFSGKGGFRDVIKNLGLTGMGTEGLLNQPLFQEPDVSQLYKTDESDEAVLMKLLNKMFKGG